MAIQMNIAEAKAKLSELIARAEAGEEVVIARDGKPAVVLTPAAAKRKKPIRLGAYEHLGPMEDPYLFLRPDPELEALMDASVFPDPDPTKAR
ncbi:MAG: type II toxin-antitoxin system prevent-host-death family antitoxin [Alphaproteobacteria bacterium]|nr:type II toxin-antitoxin system prevent-host-death family antitoxin [Alphaproteobacteria bacterium]